MCYNFESGSRPLQEVHTPDSPSTRISLDQLASGVDEGQQAVFRTLRRRASSDGLPVYLVGGPVRDAVLGTPVKDLDFVLLGDAPALAEELARELGGEVTLHTRFGTATVEVDGDRTDVVTARREEFPYPGSLPQVSASNLEDDLSRRDFSINALALPLSGDFPEVIDHHGGMEDLAGRTVRTLHRGSFADDPTRMLRAVRYEQRLGFWIADHTLAELGEALATGHASAVTGDRWRQELKKIFDEDRAAAMLLRAMELEILAAVHPAISDRQALVHLTAQNSQEPMGMGPMDYLAALTVSLTPAEGDSVTQRLNLPAAWARVAHDTIALRDLASVLSGPSLRPSVVCRALDGFDSDAIAASARLSQDGNVALRLRQYLTEWRLIELALTGNDLLAMGVPSGPKIGEALSELHSAKQDGLIGSKEEERALVNQIISRGS